MSLRSVPTPVHARATKQQSYAIALPHTPNNVTDRTGCVAVDGSAPAKTAYVSSSSVPATNASTGVLVIDGIPAGDLVDLAFYARNISAGVEGDANGQSFTVDIWSIADIGRGGTSEYMFTWLGKFSLTVGDTATGLSIIPSTAKWVDTISVTDEASATPAVVVGKAASDAPLRLLLDNIGSIGLVTKFSGGNAGVQCGVIHSQR